MYRYRYIHTYVYIYILDSVQEQEMFKPKCYSYLLGVVVILFYFVLPLSFQEVLFSSIACLTEVGDPFLDSSNQPWTDELFKLFGKCLRIPFRKFQLLQQL